MGGDVAEVDPHRPFPLLLYSTLSPPFCLLIKIGVSVLLKWGLILMRGVVMPLKGPHLQGFVSSFPKISLWRYSVWLHSSKDVKGHSCHEVSLAALVQLQMPAGQPPTIDQMVPDNFIESVQSGHFGMPASFRWVRRHLCCRMHSWAVCPLAEFPGTPLGIEQMPSCLLSLSF